MDDTSGIRLLAGLVDILRDKDGSAKLLTKLQAHEDAAATSLQEASDKQAKAAEVLAEAQAHHAESSRLRNEMLHKLTPREEEVAKGAQFVQKMRSDLDARDKSITTRETEMTRRENAAAARENKIAEDEKVLKIEKDRVAALKAAYQSKIDNIKKAATG